MKQRDKCGSAALTGPFRNMRLSPLMQALAVLLSAAGGVSLSAAPAYASPGTNWFAAGNSAGQARHMQRATSPNRALPATARQQAQARERLQHSVANWTAATRAIVEQQNVTQKAGREAARNAAWVRDGVGVDGLDPLAGGQWDAAAIETSGADASGRHPVKIAQNRSRAILDWQSFHVGRNTDLQFVQQSTDVVLNRVKGDESPRVL